VTKEAFRTKEKKCLHGKKIDAQKKIEYASLMRERE